MHTCKWMLSALLCAGIAGFAIVSLASGGGLFTPIGNPTVLQKADDPVQNGLRIINTRTVGAPRHQRMTNEDSTVILLDDWIFTGKGTASPFN